jgi:3-deoxy-7-phosphoheptulonate synthase
MLRAESGQPRTEIERFTLPSSGVFTSHEALHLPLESTMTRFGYNTSAHMLWIGERTRQLDGGHVEYLRGVKNPVGVKLGPTTNPSDLIEMLDKLNPRGTVGKIILITRMGAKNVEDKLPALIREIKKSNHVPVWLCDPCHGNTVSTPSKVKTRIVEQMLEELKLTHLIHAENDSQLGGIHIEQTGEADVTECLDSYGQDLSQAQFPEYRTLCDPRLSKSQAMFLIREYVHFAKALAQEASQVETINLELVHGSKEQVVLKTAPGLALQV